MLRAVHCHILDIKQHSAIPRQTHLMLLPLGHAASCMTDCCALASCLRWLTVLAQGCVGLQAISDWAKSRTLQEQRRFLPVYDCRDELLQVIRENQVVVVVGETGSGKTTQVQCSEISCCIR